MFRAPASPCRTIGEKLVLHIDWDRRYKLMRMHTACHLLTVVCPYPITGASVGEDESRVDFDMPDTRWRQGRASRAKLMELVDANHPVFTRWITDDELAANPGLVKSKNVRPPTGTGRIRLVCIGENGAVDSQPCGGTHVVRNAGSRRDPHRQDREEGPREPPLPHPLRPAARKLSEGSPCETRRILPLRRGALFLRKPASRCPTSAATARSAARRPAAAVTRSTSWAAPRRLQVEGEENITVFHARMDGWPKAGGERRFCKHCGSRTVGL